MTDRTTFEQYLDFRIDRAQALTPGKKLALVEELLAEAHQGRVPVSRDTVARVPVDSRSVQAVLAGEPVSMGQARMQARSDGAAAILTRVQELSVGARLGIMVAIVAIFGLLGFWGFSWLGGGQEASAAGELTPTPQGTPATGVVLNETDPGNGGSDPASLQVGATSFVLGRGKLDDGAWEPVQAEWLEDTQVRRVVAIPIDLLKEQIQRDDILRLRLRNGFSVPYRVVEISQVQRTQIEVLSSLEPSLVVILFDETAASTRQVVIARLDQKEMGIEPVANTYLVSGPAGEINLRERPFGAIVGVLENGTAVQVQTDVEPVNDSGYRWVRVQTSYGAEGWVAAELLAELPEE
jgi:hypothetical protein